MQKQMEALAEAKTEFTGIRTGYYDFDNMTRGLQNKQVIIIAGRPGLSPTPRKGTPASGRRGDRSPPPR